MELTTVMLVLGTLGIAKVVEIVISNYFSQRKNKGELKTAYHGKEIDADVNAFNSLYERVGKLEEWLYQVQTALTEQKVENAKLEADNVYLAKENARLQDELNRQRQKIHDLANDLQNKELQITEMTFALKKRDEELAVLKIELHETTIGLNRLKQEVAAMHRKKEADK